MAAYISLLDLQRVMHRALKRSGLPVWYTKGFNPHIYLAFSCPLALGQESLCESCEVKTELEDPDYIAWADALRPALPEAAAIVAATVAARVLSSLCNYLINYFLVFQSHTAHGRSASLYTVITVLKTLASALLVAWLAALLPAVPELGLKIPVDVALFFLNYLAQKALVY